MKLIKSYKLFLESSSISLEEKTKYLADAYWSYNYVININSVSIISIYLIDFLDDLILKTLNLDDYMYLSDGGYGDASYEAFINEVTGIELTTDMVEEIEHKYDMLKELELKSKLLSKKKVKDYFLHIEDILDEYANDLYKPIIEINKFYSKKHNICYIIQISHNVYKGNSYSHASIDSERSKELVDKLKPELDFIQSMIELDNPELKIIYKFSYSGFEVVIICK